MGGHPTQDSLLPAGWGRTSITSSSSRWPCGAHPLIMSLSRDFHEENHLIASLHFATSRVYIKDPSPFWSTNGPDFRFTRRLRPILTSSLFFLLLASWHDRIQRWLVSESFFLCTAGRLQIEPSWARDSSSRWHCFLSTYRSTTHTSLLFFQLFNHHLSLLEPYLSC